MEPISLGGESRARNNTSSQTASHLAAVFSFSLVAGLDEDEAAALNSLLLSVLVTSGFTIAVGKRNDLAMRLTTEPIV